MKGFFISGTDTNVGKTIASAAFLARAVEHFDAVGYHKPLQTGLPKDNDSETIWSLMPSSKRLTTSFGLGFKKPLSPHLAASYENTSINFSSVVKNTRSMCTKDFNIVEGAGGLLVPINHRYLMIDLIKELGLPCVLVVRSTLGTINPTLLSIEALKVRRIPLLGVVMVGPRNRDNEASLKFYGRINNLIALPYLSTVNQDSLAIMVKDHGRLLDDFLLGDNKNG